MEIDNAVFQELESFGQGRFFKMSMENFEFLFEIFLGHPKISVVENNVFPFLWGFKT